MGSESSADPPLCGENPQSFNSRLQVTEAVMKNSQLILTSRRRVTRVTWSPHALPTPAAAFLVAAGRKAHSLSWCSQLFRLCRMEEIDVVKNKRERSDSWITEQTGEWRVRFGVLKRWPWHLKRNGKHLTETPNLYLPLLTQYIYNYLMLHYL